MWKDKKREFSFDAVFGAEVSQEKVGGGRQAPAGAGRDARRARASMSIHASLRPAPPACLACLPCPAVPSHPAPSARSSFCRSSAAGAAAQVFEDTKHLVQSAVDGYNVCIFAYGQVRRGKEDSYSASCAMCCPRRVSCCVRWPCCAHECDVCPPC